MVSQGGGGWGRPTWGATFSSEGKTRSSDAGGGPSGGDSGGGSTAVADGSGGGLTFWQRNRRTDSLDWRAPERVKGVQVLNAGISKRQEDQCREVTRSTWCIRARK
ncbi:hypothetical protein V1478_003025 [Vespula squamosa]|uniref:Uncharacterized protein n=1 Tax=Vespula squamosa TaxID=30214 RepID=A0ABD2BS11_VESSQ